MNVNTLVSTTLAGARPLGVRGEPLHNAHDQIRGALRRRLGERYARLLAEPQSYDSGRATNWYTAATGPVQRFSSLPETRQQALLSEVDGLLGDIEALARRFGEAESEDGRLLGRALSLAVRRPSDDYLFLVGDQPVIVCWGYESDSTGAPVAPVLVPESERPRALPEAMPDGAVADDHVAFPVALAAGTQRSARRWWAASATAAFLVIGTAWAMQGFTGIDTVFDTASSEVPPPPAPAAIAVVEQHVRLSAALAQSRARSEELGVELASLQEQARRELERCRAPATPITPPDEPRGEEARGLGPPAVSTADSMAAATTTTLCPPPRRPGMPPPEVTIILDGSPSMNMPSGLNAAQEDGLATRSRRGDREAASEIKTLIQSPGPKRLDDAKQAVTQVIPQLPPDVRVGFVVFDDCRAIQDFGFFGAADRPRLISLIQSKTARGGTPLARAIETAANGLRSANGTIVVFSDGRDSCGGNICAVAQRLHAAKPGVRIHLVDVAGSADESTCLATITGGKIYSATSAQTALDAFTDATTSVQVPQQCRPRN